MFSSGDMVSISDSFLHWVSVPCDFHLLQPKCQWMPIMLYVRQVMHRDFYMPSTYNARDIRVGQEQWLPIVMRQMCQLAFMLMPRNIWHKQLQGEELILPHLFRGFSPRFCLWEFWAWDPAVCHDWRSVHAADTIHLLMKRKRKEVGAMKWVRSR